MNQDLNPLKYRCPECGEDFLPRDIPTILSLIGQNRFTSKCTDTDCPGKIDCVTVRIYAVVKFVQVLLWTNTGRTIPF